MVQTPPNGLPSGGATGKYSLLGFGYPPPESLRSQANSPERPPSRPSSRDLPERLWDLHFDRKSAVVGVGEPAGREETLPQGREGLAA